MDRFSRQIGAYGLECMGQLIKMNVLVVGMRGVGVEVAKNLALAGPRSVTLFDPAPATPADPGSNVRPTAAPRARPLCLMMGRGSWRGGGRGGGGGEYAPTPCPAAAPA